MDIVDVSTVSDEEFQWGIDYLDKKAGRLTEKLHAFDDHASEQLTSTEEDLQRMESYIQDIASMTSNHQLIPSSYEPNQINKLDSHKEMLAGLSQKVISKEYFLDYFFSFVHPMNVVKIMLGVNPVFLLYQTVQKVDSEKAVTREYRGRALQQKSTSRSEILSQDEWERNTATIIETVFVEDYKGEWDGEYLTLEDGRIVRSYTTSTGVQQYEYVEAIPKARIEEPEEEKGMSIYLDKALDLGKQGAEIGWNAAKATADFWWLDDANTLIDEDASFGDKLWAASSFVPIPGIQLITKTKHGVKLFTSSGVRKGRKVNDGGNGHSQANRNNNLKNINIKDFEIKDKHLKNSTAKRSRKFNVSTSEEANKIVQDVIKNGKVYKIADNGIGSQGQKSFSAIIDAGKVIRSKGENYLKLVYDELNNVWTTYPVPAPK
ncbi:hypothetical protein J11TS1_29700 [Oceanobacillus sp. J11TS1]|nr:hypothetical protein J11TS1_29700 [Oceanobacillus sp. J11TS1]